MQGGPGNNPPPPTTTRTDRNSGAAVSRVGAAGRTRTYRLTGAAQDTVPEEAVTLVGDSTGLTAEAKVREGAMVSTLTPPPPSPPRRTD